MPNMNGLDALKGIKAEHPEVKVVMCTSAGQDKIIAEAVRKSMNKIVLFGCKISGWVALK